MDEKVFLDTIKKKVLQHDANAAVILFGSRARGHFPEDSDWDILVLTSKEADNTLQQHIRDSLLEFRRKVTFLFAL